MKKLISKYFSASISTFIIAIATLTINIEKVRSEGLNGKEIAQLAFDRDDGETSQAIWDVTLVSKDRVLETRKMESITQDVTSTSTNRVIRFIEPALIRGTSVLFLENGEGDETTYLYLPTLKKERRINGSQKTKRFANTEFTYEDLERREVDLDSHTLKGEEAVFESNCHVIVSIPKNPSSTEYSKRKIWIDKSSFIVRKVQFFNTDGDLIKELLGKVAKKKDGYWTITEVQMKNYETDKSTLMNLRSIEYNQSIPESLFHPKRFGRI